MKVGNLVEYSKDWLADNFYSEKELADKAGVGMVLSETNEDEAWGPAYLISWSGDFWTTWEYERDLEVLSES